MHPIAIRQRTSTCPTAQTNQRSFNRFRDERQGLEFSANMRTIAKWLCLTQPTHTIQILFSRLQIHAEQGIFYVLGHLLQGQGCCMAAFSSGVVGLCLFSMSNVLVLKQIIIRRFVLIWFKRQIMQVMNIIASSKTKKQAKANQQHKQIVVCPNCQHHFKVSLIQLPFPVDKTKAISEKDMLQSYDKVSLQNSRQRTVGWKEMPILKANEQLLIQSIKNNQFTTIQKLKKLNDLNQLKKSRLMAQSKIISAFSEAKPIQLQDQHISGRQPITEREILVQQHKNPRQSKLDHRSIDSQSIIEQGLQKNMVLQTLNSLLEWIQSFELGHILPSFLKQMVQSYYLQNKNPKGPTKSFQTQQILHII